MFTKTSKRSGIAGIFRRGFKQPKIDLNFNVLLFFSYAEEEFIRREDLNFVTRPINIHISIDSREDIVPFVSEESDLDENEREVVSYFIYFKMSSRLCLSEANVAN